jgi:signal peptidase I
MTHQDTAGRVPPARQPQRLPSRGRTGRRVRRVVFWALFGLAIALLLTSLATLALSTRGFVDSSPTMEQTINPGDHLFVAPGSSVRRGDVVVLHVPATATGPDSTFVKRVIGLPGDHVACCDARGRVTVNGKPLNETYLYPGDHPSVVSFSVRLGPGQIWVMGDRRNISLDSRSWGPVRESGIVGRVIAVEHGFSMTALRTPRTFVADGLAPADTRLDHYLRLIFLAAGCVAVLLILAVTGLVSALIRGWRSRRTAPPLPGLPPDGPVPAPRTPSAPESSFGGQPAPRPEPVLPSEPASWPGADPLPPLEPDSP